MGMLHSLVTGLLLWLILPKSNHGLCVTIVTLFEVPSPQHVCKCLEVQCLLGRQELYVSVPKLSSLQWHPFTTIPGEHPATLVSVIKKYGSWTADLVQRYASPGLDLEQLAPQSCLAIAVTSYVTV